MEDQSSKGIEVHQINLNKCRLAQIELVNKLKRHKQVLALIQEPYCYKGQMALLPTNVTIIPSGRGGSPRAAIYISKNLKAKEVSNLVTRDSAACLVSLENRSTLIASVYLDITTGVLTDSLKAIVDFAFMRRYALLIGIDTNAHNTAWGHSNNTRGENLLDFIIDNRLQIHNIGKSYTFECNTGKSVIDLTLSRLFSVSINDWRVSKKMNHSDHHTIRFKLDTGDMIIPAHRQWNKVDWDKFVKEMDSKHIYIYHPLLHPKAWTKWFIKCIHALIKRWTRPVLRCRRQWSAKEIHGSLKP